MRICCFFGLYINIFYEKIFTAWNNQNKGDEVNVFEKLHI